MAKYFKTIIAFSLLLVFIAPDTFAMSSNQSLQARKNWRKWKTYSKNYKGNIVKGKVIKFDRNSIRQPYEFSSPVVDNNFLFIGVHDNEFYSVDLKRKRKVWTVKTSGEIENKAVVFEDKVYIGDNDGFIYSFDKSSGKEIWKKNILEPVASSPAISNGKLFIISSTGRLYALDLNTGDEIWNTLANERTLGFTLHTSPAPLIINDKIYFGTPSGLVLCFSEQGQKLWEIFIGDESAEISDIADMITDGTKIYISVADGRVISINQKGEIIWQFDVEGAYGLSLHNNDLFVSGTNSIFRLNADTGLPSWEHQFDNIPGLSKPTVSKNFVAVSSTNKQLYVLAIEDGEIILNRYLRGGSFSRPIIDNDKLFVLSNASRLYSFKISVKPKTKK